MLRNRKSHIVRKMVQLALARSISCAFHEEGVIMSKAADRRDEPNASLNGPRAMSRVLRLFDALADLEAGLSLAEITDELNVPKSTLRNSLLPLVNDGYLLSSGTRYRLGPRTYRLAARIMAGWSLPMNIRPFMKQLSEDTGESVAVAQLDRDGKRFIFVDTVGSVHGVRFVMSPGRSGKLHVGASGQVLLAFQDEAYREAYLSSETLDAGTPHTIVEPDALRERLDAIRRTGVAVAIDESVLDGTALAAPVFGPKGQIVAALTVAGPTVRLKRQIDEIAGKLIEQSRAASGGAIPLDV
jgi:DNA-binding IclR family transcriptional regulator